MNIRESIISKYFIITPKVKTFIDSLDKLESFEVPLEISNFLKSNQFILTIAEKNCLVEIRNSLLQPITNSEQRTRTTY